VDGMMVGSRVLCPAELVTELICEESELICDDSDDKIDETVVGFGKFKLLVVLARPDVVDGIPVGSDMLDSTELIAELICDDSELI